ncbi:hypothetical protein AUP68_04372 [Ilyonectria robusta]
MAETLGLVAGILQVVDFSRQFVVTARKIHKSGIEGLDSLSDHQVFAKNLQVVVDALLDESANSEATTGDNSDDTLAKECASTLSDMIETLGSIHIPSKGLKRDTAVQSFKVLWNKDKINALQDRLDKYSKQLTLKLILSLRMHANTSLQNQQEILDKLATLTGDRNTLPEETSLASNGFGSAVIAYLAGPLQESSRSNGKLFLRQALVNEVYQGGRDGEASSKIGMSESHRASLYGIFLASLHFPGNQDREQRIAEAHQQTFRWIFEDPNDDPHAVSWSSFKDWLQSDDQLYWITGKAGAGKSTLMKFVTQPARTPGAYSPPEARCAKYLHNRTQEKPFIVASFYFWAGGSMVQKSTTGMFLTILAQLLQAYPEAIPFVSPNAWEALSLFDEPPRSLTHGEVGAMFRRAVMHIDSLATPVLFIDGLDEFDGNHQELISLLHDLVSASSVKLCVSSRPWVEFEKAFVHQPSLRLEDLTYSDIKSYVSSRFLGDLSFKDLLQSETNFAKALIEEVVVKASGVFLWVQLVVNSLLSGIRFGDRVIDLKRRLDLLPPDLEKLYGRILDSLDPFYRRHATEYFALMEACVEPPRALLLSFADEENPIKFALRLKSAAMTPEQIKDRVNSMRLRINSRSKGLLEMDRSNQHPGQSTLNPRDFKVHYLHKTVKDYIGSPEAQRKLERISDDIHLKLLAARLALFKAIPGNDPNVYDSTVEDYMYHAARTLPEHKFDIIHLMDDFYEVTVSKNILIPFPKEARNQPGDISLASRFLCQAAKFGVYQYVSAKANKDCLISHDGSTDRKGHSQERAANKGRGRFVQAAAKLAPGLFQPTGNGYPLLLLPVESNNPWNDFTVKTMEAILQKGGNPNYSFDFHYCARVKAPTAWKVVIARIVCASAYQSIYARDRKALGKVAQQMISYGAVVSQSTVEDALEILADRIVVRHGVVQWRYESDHWYQIRNKEEIKQLVYGVLKRSKASQGRSAIEIGQEYRLQTSGNAYGMQIQL